MAPQITVGFLGLGIMGTAMARNLLKSGQFVNVYVWNRTLSKCDELAAEGALVGQTPAEVISKCDLTFGILADPSAALAVVTSPGGVLEGITAGKAYIDMSTVDEQTSQQISAAILAKGGRFLEAPVAGSKKPAMDGTLVILSAGDEGLYKECAAAFDIMGKKALYLGAIGNGARMKLVVNMIMGAMMGGFCEGMALADKAGLSQTDLLEVLSQSAIANPMFAFKGPNLVQREYPTAFPLKHQQKDLRLAVALGDAVGQPLPVCSAANEAFKAARAKGHGDDDFAAVYEATQAAAKPASSLKQ